MPHTEPGSQILLVGGLICALEEERPLSLCVNPCESATISTRWRTWLRRCVGERRCDEPLCLTGRARAGGGRVRWVLHRGPGGLTCLSLCSGDDK